MTTLTAIQVPDDLAADSRAQVLRWFKPAGARVAKDEPLVELETDKVTVEVASPCDGTLAEISAGPQSACPAGAVLGQVRADGAPADATAATTIAAPPAKEQARPAQRDAHHLLSPAVRALLHKHQLDPEGITGTGRDGRITAADVKAHLAQGQSPVAAAPAATPPPPTLPPPAADSGMRFVEHSAVRKRIAARMVESLLHTSPHVTSVFEADLGAVLAHRAAHRAALERRGVQLTLTAYFAQACIAALKAVPEANARWRDEGLELYETVDLGIATALADGSLVVPVLRHLAQYTLEGIAEQLTALTRRARDGALTRADVATGTFTLSNHGVSGSLLAAPVVINPPQTAILGIGKLEKRVVVLEQDGMESIAIRPRCYLSLTIDHRAMDGAHANRFLGVFIDALQRPG